MKKGARIAGGSFFKIRRQIVLTAVLTVSLMAVFGSQFFFKQQAAETAPPAAPTAQFCNSNPISITGSLGQGPASPFPSNIQVSGLTGVITDVSLTLNNLQHNWGRDIDVLLVGPNGEKFIVMADV